MKQNYMVGAAIIAASLITAAVFVTGCATTALQDCPSKKADSPVATAPADTTRTTHLAFAGGNTAISLTDREIINEFAERQPLSIPLKRLPDRIIIEDVPEIFVHRTDGAVVMPHIGDIVIDTDRQEVALYCMDSQPVAHGIVVGKVTSGIEDLSRQEGDFQGFATK